jgi:hypothetical protein
VTDTGEVAEMLDVAHRAWPDVADRKELLLRLAAEGRDAVRAHLDGAEDERRRAAQREALARAPERLDVELLLSDAAWR